MAGGQAGHVAVLVRELEVLLCLCVCVEGSVVCEQAPFDKGDGFLIGGPADRPVVPSSPPPHAPSLPSLPPSHTRTAHVGGWTCSGLSNGRWGGCWMKPERKRKTGGLRKPVSVEAPRAFRPPPLPPSGQNQATCTAARCTHGREHDPVHTHTHTHTPNKKHTHPTRQSALRSPAWRRRCAPAASCCGTPWRGGGGGGGAGRVGEARRGGGGEGANALLGWGGVVLFHNFLRCARPTPVLLPTPLQTHTHTTRPPPNTMPPTTAAAASLALAALLLAAPAACAGPRGSIAPPVPATPVTPEPGLVRAYGADGGASVSPPPPCASEAECVKACDGGADWTRGGEGRSPTATMAAEVSGWWWRWEERGGRRRVREGAARQSSSRSPHEKKKNASACPQKTTLLHPHPPPPAPSTTHLFPHSSWPAPTPCARRPPTLPSL